MRLQACITESAPHRRGASPSRSSPLKNERQEEQMTITESKGRDLFIVDNSVSGWTALRYLEEWSGIAKAFDIATGYFEIGALLALGEKWKQLEKIRILMGAEITHRTRKAILDAVRSQALVVLDGSIETDKETNPFLT